MYLKEVNNKDEWNRFIFTIPRTPFHQTWEWGELEASRGEVVRRWQVFDDTWLVAQAQVWYHRMPGGFWYAYMPRGPVFADGLSNDEKKSVVETLVQEVQKKYNPIFLLWEPLEEHFMPAGLRRAQNRLPQHTIFINLEQPGDVLRSALHEKWRYNIGLAQRKGVKVVFDERVESLEHFFSLSSQTAQRNNFSIPPRAHFKQLFESGLRAVLAVAFYNGQPIAANILLAAGDTVTYLHGASGNEFRNVMAPHLLQWRAMQWSAEQGFKYYDLWGVAPSGSFQEQAWAGITRFKQGFGGKIIAYPMAKKYVYKALFNIVYSLYRR